MKKSRNDNLWSPKIPGTIPVAYTAVRRRSGDLYDKHLRISPYYFPLLLKNPELFFGKKVSIGYFKVDCLYSEVVESVSMLLIPESDVRLKCKCQVQVF